MFDPYYMFAIIISLVIGVGVLSDFLIRKHLPVGKLSKPMVIYGLIVHPFLMGGLLFNYIDRPPPLSLCALVENPLTWCILLYLVSALWLRSWPYISSVVALSTVWNDFLWPCFYMNGLPNTLGDPFDYHVIWTAEFVGVNIPVSPAITFWSFVLRLGYVAFMMCLEREMQGDFSRTAAAPTPMTRWNLANRKQ